MGEMFANDNGLTSKVYRQLVYLNIKRKKTQWKQKLLEDLNKHSSKKNPVG